jgi:hypothetical protein
VNTLVDTREPRVCIIITRSLIQEEDQARGLFDLLRECCMIPWFDDILGTLCLIIYTLTLIPLVKYCYIVLEANDNGNGASPPPHPLQPGCSTTLRKINSRSTNNALQLKGREKNWCKKGELMGEW